MSPPGALWTLWARSTPARILTVARMRDRLHGSDYRVDDSLIAMAIVDRVCDIGLISRLH